MINESKGTIGESNGMGRTRRRNDGRTERGQAVIVGERLAIRALGDGAKVAPVRTATEIQERGQRAPDLAVRLGGCDGRRGVRQQPVRARHVHGERGVVDGRPARHHRPLESTVRRSRRRRRRRQRGWLAAAGHPAHHWTGRRRASAAYNVDRAQHKSELNRATGSTGAPVSNADVARRA